MSSTEPQIPGWLANARFEDLFLNQQPARALNQPDKLAIAAAAASPHVSPKLRVLAHELLLETGHAVDLALVETYCRTLPETFSHNAWGMPGHYAERLGKTVIAFGRAALPCLTALFEDVRPLGYFGSEEPTVSGQMQYRVADLAAYLVSLIVGTPYRDSPDPKARDLFISQLKSELGR